MKLQHKDLVMKCLEEIEALQQHIQNIETACQVISRDRPGKNVDPGNLRSMLIDAELTAWRNLAMWGLALDDEERKRIKAAVYARFLKDSGISHWTNGGVPATSWLKADDDAFRQMALKLFSPKDVRRR